ncbi:Panacea domain-containing protein [Neorhizobium sp. NPDC001467]|uniref:Panacea domain-containing protein n=1 Tax=Neorhizobium sp. NPDC001467 TaxID=3390595 RepID=UPI003CFDD163
MITTSSAAKHLCDISGWRLSNLQLQKMLYLADMNFVGTFGERLINENFEAWDYGPVLPSLYHRVKAFGAKAVPNVFWGSAPVVGREAQMIQTAWDKLQTQSPGELVENTHWSNGAWAKRYVPGVRGIKISIEDMADEYRNRTAGR